jgi:hypothetical protein
MSVINPFTELKKLFYTSMKWNAFEGISYQLLLTLHTIILYSKTTHSLFGQMSILLTSVYLIQPLLNLAFDQTCSLLANRKEDAAQSFFWSAVFTQIIVQTILASLFCIIVLLRGYNFFGMTLTSYEQLLASACIITEVNRRTLRHILQYKFYNKITALVEIIAGILYVSNFWLLVQSIGYTATTVLTPLLIQSLFSLFVLIGTSYYIVKNDHINSIKPEINALLIKERSMFLASVMIRFPFNYNTLLYTFGLLFGPVITATLKITSTLSAMIAVAIDHIIGSPIIALISHLKEHERAQHDLIYFVSNTLFTIILSLISFIMISSHSVISACSTTASNWVMIVLYLIFILCEQLISVSEKTLYLINKLAITRPRLITSVIIWVLSLLSAYATHMNPTLLLIVLVANRGYIACTHLYFIARVYEVKKAPQIRGLLFFILLLSLIAAMVILNFARSCSIS